MVAWYHGRRGHQRVTATELAIIASLVALGGVGAFLLAARVPGTDPVGEARPASGEAGSPSIAILPFDDLSPEGHQEYFASGMAEELMSVLAAQPNLTVVARTSAAAAKRDGLSIREIGDRLGVQNVMEGSLRKDDRRIRITTGMLRFLEQDDELAFVVAHEVSHILLGHAGAFDGASPGKAEAEADRLGIRIVSQAGFDTDIAARLPERLARSYPQAMGRSAAYGLPAERSALIRSALSDHSVRGTPIDPQGPCGQHG